MEAPTTGGAATGYTVNYRVTSVGGAWTAQSATGTGLTASGLAAATGYDFEVIANNATGSGPASSIATGTTLAAPTQAPGQVTGLVASGPTASTVNLAWTAPASGGAVASYTVQYRVTGGGGFNTAASGVAGTAYTVTGLAASTGYDFQVVAVNAVGNGTASAVASATTTAAPPAMPGVPTGLTAGTPTPSTMPLTWAAPSSGGAVASYTVRSSLHGANTWTTVTGISGTAYTVTDLLASTSYDFEVAAVNVTGSSAFTAATTATMGGGLTAPGLPTGAATSASIPVSWTAPTTGGAAASYTVQYRVTGTSGWTQSGTLTGTSTTLESFVASTSYDIQVQATNSAGSSGYTATVTAATIATTSGGSATAAWNVYQSTLVHGGGGNIFNVAATGTAPAKVALGLSASATVPPSPMPAVIDGWAANFNGNRL
jgi:hypothetical protein